MRLTFQIAFGVVIALLVYDGFKLASALSNPLATDERDFTRNQSLKRVKYLSAVALIVGLVYYFR